MQILKTKKKAGRKIRTKRERKGGKKADGRAIHMQRAKERKRAYVPFGCCEAGLLDDDIRALSCEPAASVAIFC